MVGAKGGVRQGVKCGGTTPVCAVGSFAEVAGTVDRGPWPSLEGALGHHLESGTQATGSSPLSLITAQAAGEAK
jgi:hypothetical protein